MWRTVAYGLSAVAGLFGGLISGLISPLATCICCGPFGGLLAGGAACVVPPRATPRGASRIGLLGGLAFGIGAILGNGIALLIGLATGSIQEGQKRFLELLGGQPPSPSETQAGLIVGVLFAFCAIAIGTVGLSVAAGWLGARLSLTLFPSPPRDDLSA